jgi:hypothetical protein
MAGSLTKGIRYLFKVNLLSVVVDERFNPQRAPLPHDELQDKIV